MNQTTNGPMQQWLQRWHGLATRDRRGLLAIGIVLGLFVLWLLAIQPALRTLREAPAQLDALDTQLQSMQRLASETTQLRATAPISAEQSAQALKAASERLGAAAKLNLQGDRAVLIVNGVASGALRQWLAEARSGARARPLEAQLSRGPNGYTGTVVVALGGAP